MKSRKELCDYGIIRYLNDQDKVHRISGIPIPDKRSDGAKFWWVKGSPHRIYGPSDEYSDGAKYWWVNSQPFNVFKAV